MRRRLSALPTGTTLKVNDEFIPDSRVGELGLAPDRPWWQRHSWLCLPFVVLGLLVGLVMAGITGAVVWIVLEGLLESIGHLLERLLEWMGEHFGSDDSS